MNQQLVRVGDVAEQIRGVTYGKDEASLTPRFDYAPILRAGNITEEGLSFDNLVFVPASRVSERQRIRRHDVVIAASSGSLDIVGKAAPATADFSGGFGAFCKVMRPGPQVDPEYFGHFFKTRAYRRKISGLAAGININNLRNEDLNDLVIPLPPRPEQRRIADVLNRAEALRAKRRATLAQTKELTAGIFNEMFGDPAANLREWPALPLGEVMSEVYRYPTYYGITYVEVGVPEIRGELLQEDGSIIADIDHLRFISPETSARFPRTVLEEGDLVMSVRGTIGKIGLVPATLAGANMTANLIRMAPKRSILNSRFAWYFTQTAYFKRQLVSASSSTTIQTIKAPDLKGIMVPLPPLSLQLEFASRDMAVERLKTSQRASLVEWEALFAGLQHRAFRGEL
jgi:type I restriction enzyme, S subunit